MSGDGTRRTSFFLFLSNGTKIELHQDAISIGSDGRDYCLSVDEELLLRNATTKRSAPPLPGPTNVSE